MVSNSEFEDKRRAERRGGEDRRTDQLQVPDEQRESEAAERRRSTDRRGWPFGIILRTTESYSVLEDWLEENCSGEWGMGLADMDEALTNKSFKVMFELEADKLNFINFFSRH